MTGKTSIRFGEFELDPVEWQLIHAGSRVDLDPQIFQLIRALAENSGKTLSRDDLIQKVWNGRIVSDSAIDAGISLARRALGDDGRRQEIIKTVHRRGYRFLPDVCSKPDQVVHGGASDATVQVNDRPSIVIRPFEALSRSNECAELAQGLRIDIQNVLTLIPGVFIIAAGSAAATSGGSVETATERLAVRYALEGQVRLLGEQFRVSVQLFDAETNAIVWTAQQDGALGEVFDQIDSLSARVLSELDANIGSGKSALGWRSALRDVESLRIFYRGIDRFFRMEPEAMRAARRDFLQIAQSLPEFSIGPTWVALTWWYDFVRGWASDPERAKNLAREWAEKAVAARDCDGQANTVLAHVLLLDGEFDKAMEMGQAAVATRPNCSHANIFFANVLHRCDLNQKAIERTQIAIRHAPYHPPMFEQVLALSLFGDGRADEAETIVQDILSKAGDQASLVAALVVTDSAELRQQLRNALSLIEPEFSVGRFLDREPYKTGTFVSRLRKKLLESGLAP